MQYTINQDRLVTNILEMSRIGRNENGGIDRALGSQADYETREWLKAYWQREMGLTARVDAIANLWIERKGSEDLKPLVMGSHHDAVPDGGSYDGAMGVLAATEVMQTILEQNIPLRHPFQVISFTGEEPNPFNLSTLGSKILSGRLNREKLRDCRNRETGESLKAAIAKLGGDLDRVDEARLEKGSIAAFLELHNEMGRHLEEEKLSTSSVSVITGIYRMGLAVIGEANHAGTTMMTDRKDALLALGELALAVEKAAADFHDPDVVATIGYAKTWPNEASIIAGRMNAIIDIRTVDPAVQESILSSIHKAAREIEQRRGVVIEQKELLNQPCRPMDEIVSRAVDEGIRALGEPPKSLVSMAGHDASNMGLLTRSGMIFVQSVGGRGHCRQEYSRPEDIGKAVNAALYALLKLDKELD